MSGLILAHFRPVPRPVDFRVGRWVCEGSGNKMQAGQQCPTTAASRGCCGSGHLLRVSPQLPAVREQRGVALTQGHSGSPACLRGRSQREPPKFPRALALLALQLTDFLLWRSPSPPVVGFCFPSYPITPADYRVARSTTWKLRARHSAGPW